MFAGNEAESYVARLHNLLGGTANGTCVKRELCISVHVRLSNGYRIARAHTVLDPDSKQFIKLLRILVPPAGGWEVWGPMRLNHFHFISSPDTKRSDCNCRPGYT